MFIFRFLKYDAFFGPIPLSFSTFWYKKSKLLSFVNNNYKDKLKKIKYRCQTLGIKELDVIFERIYSKLENINDEALIDQLDDLLKNETQYIFDVFFNDSFKEDRIKYLKIINLSK